MKCEYNSLLECKEALLQKKGRELVEAGHRPCYQKARQSCEPQEVEVICNFLPRDRVRKRKE